MTDFRNFSLCKNAWYSYPSNILIAVATVYNCTTVPGTLVGTLVRCTEMGWTFCVCV